MLRMQEMAFPGFKFQNQIPDPPIHAWYVNRTHGLQPFISDPLIYYLTERSLFKKCPPPPPRGPGGAYIWNEVSVSYMWWAYTRGLILGGGLYSEIYGILAVVTFIKAIYSTSTFNKNM
jgi:hypothetical protein